MNGIAETLDRGGPVLWIIATISVATLALILWKSWRLAAMGAWSGAASERAVALWAAGDRAGAVMAVEGRTSLRATLARSAMAARSDAGLTDEQAREETARVAKAELARARSGLRVLDLVATVAPLLGLLGTVLGMIAAFQTLQQAGAQADPSALAGGIWEALLTTAAGMSVAIPASMAFSWFEGVIDRVQADMEDLATRIFTRGG
jgi:biopolymer transport protein ExbB